jgi:WD40 repeat protein
MAILFLFGAFLAVREAWVANEQRALADKQTTAANEQRAIAEEQKAGAIQDETAALTALSNASRSASPALATKLALAAWPRNTADHRPKLGVTLEALSAAVRELRERKVLRGHEAGIASAAFSPDGTRVVTASQDKTARIWDAATGKAIIVLRDHEGAVNSGAFSPDGTRVVTASEDRTARIWDAATGEAIAVLRIQNDPGYFHAVLIAAFSPDGARIVTGSADFTARLWDVATGLEIAVLRRDSMVTSATFSPDGARVLTADGTARIWDVGSIPKGNLFRIGCVWLPDHDLTDVAREYGLTNLAPICEGDPPLPSRPPNQL